MRKNPTSFKCLQITVMLMTAMTLFACARTVTVTHPPQIDLKAFPTIGVIEFAAQPSGELGEDATQKFLGNLQAAQPGVRLLELGSREKILQEVGSADLDYRAIRAIGEKYRVAAVLCGTVELSQMRPDLKLSPDLTSIRAQAKIDGKMSAKLWEASNGATIWTNSSWGNWPIAGVSLTGDGPTSVGFRNPKEKRDEILMALIRALNGDFWPTYEKRKVED